MISVVVYFLYYPPCNIQYYIRAISLLNILGVTKNHYYTTESVIINRFICHLLVFIVVSFSQSQVFIVFFIVIMSYYDKTRVPKILLLRPVTGTSESCIIFSMYYCSRYYYSFFVSLVESLRRRMNTRNQVVHFLEAVLKATIVDLDQP